MIDRVASVVSGGQPPKYVWGYEDVLGFQKPIVYVWIRGEVVLYVGMSSVGVQRPLSHQHHKLRMEPGDQLLVFEQATEKAARNNESRGIGGLRPSLNSGGFRCPSNRLAPREAAQERRRLMARLRVLDDVIAEHESNEAKRLQRASQSAADSAARVQFDMENPDYLSCDGANKYIGGRALGLIRRSIKTGELKAVKAGNVYRTTRAWIDEWLSSRALNARDIEAGLWRPTQAARDRATSPSSAEAAV